MRRSRKYQLDCKVLLEQYFDEKREVRIEWNISKEATDGFARSADTYAPCLDLAVGPFNIHQGNQREVTKEKLFQRCPRKLKNYLKSQRLFLNPNPRCALGIEVVFSGSSKHILGDITNASMMGLYGIVIVDTKMYDKVNRIHMYVNKLKQIGKAPINLFNNIIIIKTQEFLDLLS